MNTEDRSGRFVFSATSKRRLLSNLNREQSLKGILLKLFDLLLFQLGPSYFSAYFHAVWNTSTRISISIVYLILSERKQPRLLVKPLRPSQHQSFYLQFTIFYFY